MIALGRPDAARVAEISAELDTLRIGGRSAIDEVLPAVRRLLDVDNMAVYSLTEQIRGWVYERWHDVGDLAQLKAPVQRLLGGAPRDIVFYDPRCPDAWMRNRVIDATAWIDRAGPGTWLRSQLCREVFEPVGLQHHRHVRVLLCNGVELLGWFGTILPGRPARHHYRLLGALVPAMRRRMTIERRLAEAPRTHRALEGALAALGAPAFVVTGAGIVREANAAGRALADRNRVELFAAIANARAGRPDPMHIELTPVTATGAPPAWLAIVRRESPDARLAAALATAGGRWSLTPRQRTVLAHVARGDTNATIAAHLGVSTRAVELHVTALLARAGVDSRAALVAAVLVW